MTRLVSLLTIIVLLAPHLNAGEVQDSIDKTRNASWDAYYAGDFDRASAMADEVLQAVDTDAWSHLLLGKIMEDQGDWGDDHLLRAEELAGDDGAVLATLAETWLTRYSQLLYSESASAAPESGQAAERIFRRWASLEPKNVAPIHGLARVREAGGDLEGAIGFLHTAIAKDPTLGPHSDLWKYLGSNMTYPRLTAFYEGLALGPYDSATRARCRDYAGQVLAAHAGARKAAASVAASKRDNSGKVNALQEAKDLYLSAIEASEAAGKNSSYRAIAEWNIAHYKVGIAEVYRSLNDLSALIRHVENSRDLLGKVALDNPDADQPKTDITTMSDQMFLIVGGEAGARNDRARWKKAMGALQEYWHWAATKIDPENAVWWNNAGFFGRESGRYEESYTAYKRCVELEPDGVRGLNDTALILLYHLKRNYDEAEEMLLKAVALGAEQYPLTKNNKEEEAAMRSAWGDAMLNLGLVYLDTKQWDAAEKALAQLTEFDGERYDLEELVDRLAGARKINAVTNEEELQAMVTEAVAAAIAAPADVTVRNALITIHNEIIRQRDRFPNASLILQNTNNVLNLLTKLSRETRRASRSEARATAAEERAADAEAEEDAAEEDSEDPEDESFTVETPDESSDE